VVKSRLVRGSLGCGIDLPAEAANRGLNTRVRHLKLACGCKSLIAELRFE